MEQRNDKDLIAILKNHGLHVTHQRLAIYQALSDSTAHPSADMIYQQVKARFPMISLGTVYKTMELFCKVGLVRKVAPITQVAHYHRNVQAHHHFICIRCNTIQVMEDPSMDERIQVPKDNRFHTLRYTIHFHGYCPRCLESGELSGTSNRPVPPLTGKSRMK